MTDGQLWDHVHRLFGIGDWHEDCGTPFWRYRALEITKVKRRRAKLRVSCEDLAVAADYCKAHGIDIRNVAWLYRHLKDSAVWHRDRQRALAGAELDELIAVAIDIEVSNPDSPWVDRLVRARGVHRQEVYEAWKSWRASSAPSPTPVPAPASSAPTRRPE